MIPDIIACAEIMLKRWESHEGKEIDVVEEFRLFTSEVISRTAFGSSYLEGQHIFEMLKKLALILFRNSLQIKVPGVRYFLLLVIDLGVAGISIFLYVRSSERVKEPYCESVFL